MQTYTVRIAKRDSITNVEYNGIIHVWWQGNILALEKGTRYKDRVYIYYPIDQIDHVHIAEEISGE